jgi:hypothetical protein
MLEATPGQKGWWQTGRAGGHSWAEGVLADGACWRQLLGRRCGGRRGMQEVSPGQKGW